jgi:hypothetical protein
MSPASPTDHGHAPTDARAEAAALFAAVARHEQAPTSMQLHCLAAASALRAPTRPVPPTIRGSEPDRLITQALRILGRLDVDDFAHPDVLAATRHGRRALREAH